MAIDDHTPQQWREVISDLTGKATRYETEIGELKRSRDALALDSELGANGAQVQLRKIQTDLGAKQSGLQTLGTAIKLAQEKLKAAQAAEAAAADRARLAEISQHMRKYQSETEKIDELLQALAEHFIAARQHLDNATALMDSSTELAPVQQLRSTWGSTHALAFHGLDNFCSLGREAAYITHRKKLSDFTRGIIERWLVPNGNKTEQGEGEDKPNAQQA